jgi:hypothetical protein
MANKDRRTWEDEDGMKLEVFRWAKKSGQVIFDTDPDTPGIDSMVSLTRAQVKELIKFISTDE